MSPSPSRGPFTKRQDKSLYTTDVSTIQKQSLSVCQSRVLQFLAVMKHHNDFVVSNFIFVKFGTCMCVSCTYCLHCFPNFTLPKGMTHVQQGSNKTDNFTFIQKVLFCGFGCYDSEICLRVSQNCDTLFLHLPTIQSRW